MEGKGVRALGLTPMAPAVTAQPHAPHQARRQSAPLAPKRTGPGETWPSRPTTFLLQHAVCSPVRLQHGAWLYRYLVGNERAGELTLRV